MLFMVERVDFHRPRLKLNMLHIQIMLQSGASPILDSVVVMCLTNVILSCLLSLPCNLVVRYERPKFPTSMIYFGLRVAGYSLTILFSMFPFLLSDSFIIQLKPINFQSIKSKLCRLSNVHHLKASMVLNLKVVIRLCVSICSSLSQIL